MNVSVPETSPCPAVFMPIIVLEPSYRLIYKNFIPVESALKVIESKSYELVSIE